MNHGSAVAKWLKSIGAAATIVMLLTGCWFVYENWNWIAGDFFLISKEVPNFKLQDYLGEYHLRSEFLGQPLIINIWEADNPFSGEELRAFADLQADLGDRALVLAINHGESVSKAKNFTDSLGISGLIIFLVDPSGSFYRSLGGFKMPETLFVSKEGYIVDYKHGQMKLPEMKQRAERIL